MDWFLETEYVVTRKIMDRLTGIYRHGQDTRMNDSTSDEPIDILLVEDNPGDIRLTQEAFRSVERDVEFHVVTDGKAAIQYAQQRLEPDTESRPDLILLDLNLPRVDGFDVLEMLEDDFDVPPPPILVLSSSTAEEDVERSYEKGCNAYLQKPDDVGNYTDIAEAIEEFWIEHVQPPMASS